MINLHPRWFMLIKITSTVLITGALGLEFWNFRIGLPSGEGFGQWQGLLIVVHFGLLVHLIEGIIVAVISPRHQALQSAVYTFFTGTVSLWDFWQQSQKER